MSIPILSNLREKAKAKNKKVVLPEGFEPRTLKAAEILTKEKIARVVLLGNQDEILKKAKEESVNLSDIEIIDPQKSDKNEEYAQEFYNLRKHKGVTIEQAREIMKNYLYYGAMMVRKGEVSADVAGAESTTADVLRAAIPIIGLAPKITVVSSCFMMIMPEGDGRIFFYADCAVMPDPTPEQLASIAMATADTRRSLVGDEPIVAMLSFSTKKSAEHPMVDKVVKATEILKSLNPDFIFDGEMQVDAAIVPKVCEKKAPGSPVAGKANVLIFPDIDAGNIAYKLTQRLAKAEAVGPIIQGLAKPVNDLSRGCSVDDIVNVAAIALLKSQD